MLIQWGTIANSANVTNAQCVVRKTLPTSFSNSNYIVIGNGNNNGGSAWTNFHLNASSESQIYGGCFIVGTGMLTDNIFIAIGC